MKLSNSKKVISHSKQKQKFNKSLLNEKKKNHKKQIQSTLNQMYFLQSQLQKLNVPQNPHSSSPIKKQVKKLSLMYENMTKKRTKNNLNIELDDIKSAFKIINQGAISSNFKNNTKLTNNYQISLFNNMKNDDQQDSFQESISSQTLKQLMKQIYGTQFDVSLINEGDQQKLKQFKATDIQNFLNFNQSDNFDPLKQAYNCLLDQYGKFSPNKYNEINQLLGLPKLQDFQKIQKILGIKQSEQITFRKFKQVIQNGKDLYFND